jgi:hypothetical protein
MSRNLPRKSSTTPAQKTVRKSSIPTDDSSDDDGYEGVDQISDSEEDEPDVEAAEEDVIRAFEDEELTPRPESDDEGSVEDLPSPSFFTEHAAAIEPNYSSSSSSTAGSPDRRVHFDLSDDDSDSGDDKEYSDTMFFDLESLGPHFRQLIDEDVDKEVTSDNGEWWPSQESEEDAADEAEVIDSDSSESTGYLSG